MQDDLNCLLHVHGFTSDTLPANTFKIFSKHGTVQEILAFQTRNTGKNHLFVRYATPVEAAAARGKYHQGWQGDPVYHKSVFPVYEAVSKRANTYRWDGLSEFVPKALPPHAMPIGPFGQSMTHTGKAPYEPHHREKWWSDDSGSGSGHTSFGPWHRLPNDTHFRDHVKHTWHKEKKWTRAIPNKVQAKEEEKPEDALSSEPNNATSEASLDSKSLLGKLYSDDPGYEEERQSRSSERKSHRYHSSSRETGFHHKDYRRHDGPSGERDHRNRYSRHPHHSRHRPSSRSAPPSRSVSSSGSKSDHFPTASSPDIPVVDPNQARRSHSASATHRSRQGGDADTNTTKNVNQHRPHYYPRADIEDVDILKAAPIAPRLSTKAIVKPRQLRDVLLPHEVNSVDLKAPRKDANTRTERNGWNTHKPGYYKHDNGKGRYQARYPSSKWDRSWTEPKPVSNQPEGQEQVSIDELLAALATHRAAKKDLPPTGPSFSRYNTTGNNSLPYGSPYKMPPAPHTKWSYKKAASTGGLRSSENSSNQSIGSGTASVPAVRPSEDIDEQSKANGGMNEGDALSESPSTQWLSLKLGDHIIDERMKSDENQSKTQGADSSSGRGRAEGAGGATAAKQGEPHRGAYPSPEASPQFDSLGLPIGPETAQPPNTVQGTKSGVMMSMEQFQATQITRYRELYQASQAELTMERTLKRKAEDEVDKERTLRRKLEDQVWAMQVKDSKL